MNGYGNEKLQKIQLRGTLKICAAAVTLAAATLLLYAAAAVFPNFVDDIYRPFSRAVLYGLSRATGWIPFSLAEILLYLILLSALTAALRLAWVLIAGPKRAAYLARFAAWLLFYAALAVFLFCALWGLNYKAAPLAAELNLSVRPHSAAELTELNRFLADRANRCAALVARDGDGGVAEFDFDAAAEKVATEFSKETWRKEAPVKGVLASKPMSYTQITGIFVPFTAEANVNTNNVAVDLPFVMAHETAHRYAVAPEDEANFYAFYILEDAEDPLLAYSAALAALRYCQNALHAADYEAFAEIYGTYNELVVGDLKAYSEHWQQYEGSVSEVSEAVNNTYLQVQGIEDGVKSYGRMVDLMLAWYDAKVLGR